jgi:hypothetical protein
VLKKSQGKNPPMLRIRGRSTSEEQPGKSIGHMFALTMAAQSSLDLKGVRIFILRSSIMEDPRLIEKSWRGL